MRKVIIAGRLTSDARKLGSAENPFLAFSLACDEGYKDKKTTEFIDCKYNIVAVEPYLKKGRTVTVLGSFSSREYTTREGAQKFVMDVRVSEIFFGSAPNTAETQPRTAPAESAQQPSEDNGLPF